LADISALKDANMPVLVYTVNDHGPGSLAAHLGTIGVNGLFTDDPCGLSRSCEAGGTNIITTFPRSVRAGC
jgi:hypothetical protein